MATGHLGSLSLFRLFRTLRAVFRTALLAVLDALRVEHAAQDVVADARKVLHAAAADHHHRVLLEVMALARDVADHLEAVGEADLGDLAERRVRLLRRRRVDARANPALLRARLHVTRLLAVDLLLPRFPDQLLYRRHAPRPTPARRTNMTPSATPALPASTSVEFRHDK